MNIFAKLKSFFFEDSVKPQQRGQFPPEPAPRVRPITPPPAPRRPSPPKICTGKIDPRISETQSYVSRTVTEDSTSDPMFLATAVVVDALTQQSSVQDVYDQGSITGGSGNFGGAGASGSWDAPVDAPSVDTYDSMPSEVPVVPDIEPDHTPEPDSNTSDSSSDSSSSDSGSSD